MKDPFLVEVKSKVHIRETANMLFSFLLSCSSELGRDTENVG
jgi:hypothetical protein